MDLKAFLKAWNEAARGALETWPKSKILPGQPGLMTGAMPEAVAAIRVKPSVLVQGRTAAIELDGPPGMTLGGSLAGRPLHFFPQPGGKYLALQGVHALAEPGPYPLEVVGAVPEGAPFAFSRLVYVRSGGYGSDPALTVSPETIDPAVTGPEEARWSALALLATPEKQWVGAFASPLSPEQSRYFSSLFGSRRSYNGSAYIYFHTGLDFCARKGTEIKAAAAGTVVFAGLLAVRGRATMIDHGWGVYTGYLHQSKIYVRPGSRVEAGQVIGRVGSTGRVTGPHLHFEVWVGSVQVDPLDWQEASVSLAGLGSRQAAA